MQWEAKPENLYGVDLLQERINVANNISPNINFLCGNAESIAFNDKFFDIITQFTCFTSILDPEMKKNIAKEMMRLLKDDGIILWYDFRYNNPKNNDVKGIKKAEIKDLFPNCSYDFNLITLAPPIARKLALVSYLSCYLLSKIPILKTHYLIIIKKI